MRITPPPQWLNDCSIPQLEGETYQAVIELALKRKAAIDLCNEDKSSLREWVAKDSEYAGSD